MKNYAIIAFSDIEMVDFSEVVTTSIETTMMSVDGDKCVIGYMGDPPSSLASIPSLEGEYSHKEIKAIKNTPEWTITDGGGV